MHLCTSRKRKKQWELYDYNVKQLKEFVYANSFNILDIINKLRIKNDELRIKDTLAKHCKSKKDREGKI